MFNYEYIGNLHIHSLHSDGGSSVPEIAGAAIKAGLDFICLNDHDFMTDILHLPEEGFYNNLLVLVGVEIGKSSHHYLGFDLKEIIKGDSLSPQEIIDRVNDKGGIGFIAHPFEKGMPFRDKSLAFKWNDLSVSGYTGISIWNFSSRWKERVKTFFHGIFLLIFKKESLKGPSRETLSFWDNECGKRRIPAIGTSDAHGSLFKWGVFHFRPFSYDFLLSTINVHILLNRPLPEDLESAKHEIYEAMKEGRLFIAHDKLCPAKGFKFDFISNDGSNLFMGEEGTFRGGEIFIELPYKGEIRLIKDGELYRKWRGVDAFCKAKESGVYRVEVYRKIPLFGWRPWIFSNPIYLR